MRGKPVRNTANLKLALAANKAANRGQIGRTFALLLHQLGRVLFSCDIGIGAKIDDSCEFYHLGLGCVIHPDAVIGKRCKIFQHVTIGSAWRGGAAPGAGVPKVGDDVVLGCGCVLLGDIEVGDGSVIGANAVVTKSVPAGCVAVGVPARIRESH